MTNHDALGAILLVASPAWLGLYIWHLRGYRKGGRYDN